MMAGGSTSPLPMMGTAQGGVGMMGGAPQGHSYGQNSCRTSADLAGTRVAVMLADMNVTRPMLGIAPRASRMMLRADRSVVSAGAVSFVATNHGSRTHELVVLPLPADARPGQRIVGRDGKVSEANSLGEASSNCAAGAGEGIAAGSASWVTLNLKPGRYELVCNLPNHYASGMWSELDVH
jgi:uncharacterized cupredoxin-like copper-binding protein